MRFLVDMPLSPGLAEWLRTQGHDAIHALSAGLGKALDVELLKRGRDEQRVVITADLDYPRLLAQMHAKSPGLILFRGGNYSERETIERLTKTLETIPSKELSNSIVVVEKARIRRRSLPIESDG